MGDKDFQNRHAGFTYVAVGMGVTPYVNHHLKEREVKKVENTHAQWDNVMKRKPLMYEAIRGRMKKVNHQMTKMRNQENHDSLCRLRECR